MTAPAPTETPVPQQGWAGTMQDLWVITREVWDTSFLGMNVGDALLAIVVLLVTFGLRGLFSKLLFGFLKSRASKERTRMIEKVLYAITGPLRMVPIIIGVYVAVLILGLQGPEGEGLGVGVVRSLIVITIFWALHNAVTPVFHLLEPLKRALTPVLIDWLAKTLKILFLIVGGAALLQIWGIPVAPIIAGLGLFGVAVGLGAQDLFKNLIAGLLILTEKRFLPGDWILVDGVVEATVDQINFRSTRLIRFDKSPVHVPNSLLSDRAVVNFTRMSHRRIFWTIGIDQRATTAQLKYIRDEIMNWILENPEFAKPEEVATFIHVDAFGDSSIDYLLCCFTYTTGWIEWLKHKEELSFAIKRIVEDEAGTSFAYPSTSVYIEKGAEIFQPPAGDGPGGKAAPHAIERGGSPVASSGAQSGSRAVEPSGRGENTDGSQAAPGAAGAGGANAPSGESSSGGSSGSSGGGAGERG